MRAEKSLISRKTRKSGWRDSNPRPSAWQADAVKREFRRFALLSQGFGPVPRLRRFRAISARFGFVWAEGSPRLPIQPGAQAARPNTNPETITRRRPARRATDSSRTRAPVSTTVPEPMGSTPDTAPRVVVPAVAGSNPVAHPQESPANHKHVWRLGNRANWVTGPNGVQSLRENCSPAVRSGARV